MAQSDMHQPDRLYHYTQLRANRDTVRRQGTLINQSMKRMKKLARRKVPDDDTTQQYITLPPECNDSSPQPLKEALEAAATPLPRDVPEEERPYDGAASTPRRKRWYRWKD